MSKSALRRLADRRAAAQFLQDLATGKGDPYEAYVGLYGLWCSNNAALEELRPLFRIEGIDASGSFRITEQFRRLISSLAEEILLTFPTDKPSA